MGRFTAIDPVTHHSMSTYTEFDNNPVYWADPGGADAEEEDEDSDYDWKTGKYKSGSYEAVMANQGLNAGGSEIGPGGKKKKRN